MSCSEARDWLPALVDEEVSAWRRWRLQRHLAGCRGCRSEYQALRNVSSALAGLGPASAPAVLDERVAVARLGEPAAGSSSALAPRAPARRWMGAAAASAVMALAAFAATQLAQRPPTPFHAALRPTVKAASQIRTARAQGRSMHYHTGKDHRRGGFDQLAEEFWYEAPERYRHSSRAVGRVQRVIPLDWVMVDGRSQALDRHPSRSGSPLDAIDAGRHLDMVRRLFGLDESLADEAAGAQGTVSRQTVMFRGAPVHEVRIEVRKPAMIVSWRQLVDPRTRRVAYAEWTTDLRTPYDWQRASHYVVDEFEYNVPLPADTFTIYNR